MLGALHESKGHGLRDCPNDEARIEALEGTSTKYGSWLRAASVEVLRNRVSKNDSTGSGGAPSASPPDKLIEKSSGSGRVSGNNATEVGELQKRMKELGNVSNMGEGVKSREMVGLLPDSMLQLKSVGPPQSEGIRNQTLGTSDTQIAGSLEEEGGKDMEMNESGGVCYNAIRNQWDMSKIDTGAQQAGVRKWKHVARLKDQNTQPESGQIMTSTGLSSTNTFPTHDDPNSPGKSGSDGGGKRKKENIPYLGGIWSRIKEDERV
ncbi:hypothetical protein Q3G72_020805 [Acer saccharum]|nr:hypothetical protein Q3G72_020805 [Acer saccharum]